MEKDNTPVVHYFTREWAAMGHKVYVVHYAANFPRPVMWAAALVKKPLAALLGTPVRTTIVTEHEYSGGCACKVHTYDKILFACTLQQTMY